MNTKSITFLFLFSFNALADGRITNADIYSAAAIATTKLAAKTANNACTFDGSGFIGSGVAPGTSGNVLTSNGTTWASTALPADIGITQLTGDVTAGPGSGSQSATLATVNSNVGSFTYGSFTVNGKGLITAASSGTAPVTSLTVASANGFAGSFSASTTPVLTLSTTVTGILSGNGTAISAASTTGSGSVVLATSPTITTPSIAKLANLTTNGIVYTTGTDGTLNSGPLTGDITSSGVATTLATVNSNVGSFTSANITVNAKGLITAASSKPAPSTVDCNQSLGCGSTNTAVRRYTTCATTGSDITTSSDSSTNGRSFTINTAGTYAISIGDVNSTFQSICVTVNGDALTTSCNSLSRIPSGNGMIGHYQTNVSVGQPYGSSITWTFSVNDVVRVQASACPANASDYTNVSIIGPL